jgi:acid phosphatase (class A)
MCMRNFLLLLALLSSPMICAADEQPARAPDLIRLLPPPPAADSPAGASDLKAVLNVQDSRTVEDADAAKADAERSVFRFADAVGPGFRASSLPRTAAFFERVARFDKASVGVTKAYWRHPRPAVVSKAVHPLDFEMPGDWSYPSGHATFGYTAAVLLANMVPEHRTAIFERADIYAQHRIVMGAHFPSDIRAGQIAGTVIAAQLLADPAWRKDFDDVRAEIRNALSLPEPAPTSGL